MPTRPTPTPARHTVVVRLHDRPGALYRAIGLIRRRDYNVASLVVGPSETAGVSRMVLVVEAADVRQVVQQLSRLIDVLSVYEAAPGSAEARVVWTGSDAFDVPDMPDVPDVPNVPNATPNPTIR